MIAHTLPGSPCWKCPIYETCERKMQNPNKCYWRPAPFCKLKLPDDKQDQISKMDKEERALRYGMIGDAT